MKITNNAKGMQGVHTLNKGIVYLKPGQTRNDLEMDEVAVARAKTRSFLVVEGQPTKKAAKADARLPSPQRPRRHQRLPRPSQQTKSRTSPRAPLMCLP